MICRFVGSGEAAGLIASYERAVARAQRVRALLITAELDAGSVLVVPSWTETGEPAVYVSGLTDAAQRHLAEILCSGLGPAPDDDRGGGQRAA